VLSTPGWPRGSAEATGLATSALIVCVIGDFREDWSLGMGRAQFLEGDL
jgi:hypothetical protein